jgi:tRNA pseudouridine32 synthase/23S rRNA pseudouridine746 synthase
MAEFWWGKSPQKEVRRHGYYYPSCKTKCEPILNFMLQGLDVEPNIQECIKNEGNTPRVIYEDDCIIAVDKPAGMLSVPGKDNAPSVWSWAKENYPIADGPLLVHRLDMDTSGILIIAKDKETHRLLQSDFETRKVKKRYTAIVIGTVSADTGIIQLPMCPNPDDRPRQMVSEEYGKPAVTRYEVITRDKRHTRLSLYPITGRTHQLRVHCAHQQGLNAPIVGDNLYGQPDKRLYLHATSIEFRHTKTGRRLRLESPAPF